MDWPTVILILGALLIIFGAIVAVRIAEAGREAVRDFTHSALPIAPLWTTFESRIEGDADKVMEQHEKEVERMRREYGEAIAGMRERHARWTSGKPSSS